MGRLGVLVEGHFVLRSGLHSRYFFNKRLIWKCPSVTMKVCGHFAHWIAENNGDVEVIAGPAIGGIVPAFATALALSTILGREVSCVWLEKDQAGELQLPSEFVPVVEGRIVAALDDVSTRAESIQKVVKALKAAKGDVQSAMLVCNRSENTDVEIAEKLEVKRVKSLITLRLPVFSAQQESAEPCPYCFVKGQIRPIIKPGCGTPVVEGIAA